MDAALAVSSEQRTRLNQRVEEVDMALVGEIVARHAGRLGALVSILQGVQARYGYLPPEALRKVAEASGRPLVEVYGIATFYKAFRLKPRGKHSMVVCLGTACHVRGAPAVAEEVERQLGIKAGETTPDGEFTFETVNCLGACALGPVAVIDGRYNSKTSRTGVRRLIEDARAGTGTADASREAHLIPLSVRCPRCRHTLMDGEFPFDGHPTVCVTASADHNSGWCRLSSLYGTPWFSAEHDVPVGTVMRFSCPHCRADLLSDWSCPTCAAPMAEVAAEGGGVLRICPRRGCQGRMLDLI